MIKRKGESGTENVILVRCEDPPCSQERYNKYSYNLNIILYASSR